MAAFDTSYESAAKRIIFCQKKLTEANTMLYDGTQIRILRNRTSSVVSTVVTKHHAHSVSRSDRLLA